MRPDNALFFIRMGLVSPHARNGRNGGCASTCCDGDAGRSRPLEE
jgi:hypothetical protein